MTFTVFVSLNDFARSLEFKEGKQKKLGLKHCDDVYIGTTGSLHWLILVLYVVALLTSLLIVTELIRVSTVSLNVPIYF